MTALLHENRPTGGEPTSKPDFSTKIGFSVEKPHLNPDFSIVTVLPVEMCQS